MTKFDIGDLTVRVFRNKKELATAIADRISVLARKCNIQQRPFVLGLAAGASPQHTYEELARRVRRGELDLSGCVAFCLDEYYPINPEDPRVYVQQMSRIAEDLGIPDEQFHIPRGDIPREWVKQHCQQYEKEIRQVGGIDFQILGVGITGHIGFNEPGSLRTSRTRLVCLDESTRRDAAPGFGSLEYVPREAITMGIQTILEAREIALIATGEHKAEIAQKFIELSPTPVIPASFLQTHGYATIYLDVAAAKLLIDSRDYLLFPGRPVYKG